MHAVSAGESGLLHAVRIRTVETLAQPSCQAENKILPATRNAAAINGTDESVITNVYVGPGAS